jgi:hypothetical protein
MTLAMRQRLPLATALAALLAAAPTAVPAYGLHCPVSTICEGRNCFQTEPGVKLAVLVDGADRADPILMSDTGPLNARPRRTGQNLHFDGVNGLGSKEKLSANLANGAFVYMRQGTSADGKGGVTYRGTCAVVN